MTNPQVISLGSINADFQVRVERRPDVSETVPATDFLRLGGGKAANVAYLAHKLGCEVRLLGNVGDDDLAEQALKLLHEQQVPLDGVKRVPNTATGVSWIAVPPDGKKGIVLAGNANECWQQDDVDRVQRAIELATDSAVLVLDCEIPISVVEAAAQAAHARGMCILLDPSPASRVTDRLLSCTTIITPNASEAEQLTGVTCKDVQSAGEAGRKLLRCGVAGAAVKLPDGGCVFVHGECQFHVAATPVNVDDTTGAGDAFAGALAAALAEQLPVRDALRWAVAASHQVVTGYGSQAVLPDREQLCSFADTLRVCDVSV